MKPLGSWSLVWAIFAALIMVVPQSMAEDWLYTVRKGDTIWGLSHKYLKEPLKFQEIQKYNDVQLDRQIPPGVTLKFPMEYLKFAPTEVEVTAINGTAHYVRRGIKEQLKLEHQLVLDDILLTDKDSSVALLFADGSELLLGENSELVFDVQTKWGETGMVDSRMRLMKGSAEGRVRPLIGPGANFEVQTPSAVATVRGTEFRVRVDESDSGIVFNEVDEGTVSVQLHENQASVKQGFGLKTATNLPMSKPKALLPEPVFVNAQSKYPGHPVTLTWQPIDGAQGYYIELFGDVAMTKLVHKDFVNLNQTQLPEVALGEYSVRVRGVDQEGLQGLNSSHRFVISPVPSSPAVQFEHEKLLAGEPVHYRWTSKAGASQYRWRLAKDKQFRRVVEELELQTTAYQQPQGLPAGTYYWKVAAGNENGYGQDSDLVRFDVRLPVVPTIKPIASEISSDEALSFHWSAVELATEYHWQIGTDDRFENVIDEGLTADTRVTVSELPEQELFIRVAAKGPYNQNRYSDVSTVEVVEPSDGKTAFSIGSILLFILML
ncbi:FecR domain-containing protein [Kangiella taiwanensis]|uniref:LysM domain-containing protein n=1 Tax=Kangiella taiwanensis TaxID=1079179 RepID=A0ABP8HY97_9GAMM|nr:FecR domain-containing protein [Kangiella taiwanensis]